MSTELDHTTNRTASLLTEFVTELVHKYRVPPESVAKALVGVAVLLYLEHREDDQRAAADYLRKFADELDEDAPKARVN